MTVDRFPYRGPLSALLAALEHRAQHQAAAVAELPRGAFVRLTRREDGRREVRIGRLARPDTTDGLRAWGREVEVFRRELKLGHWDSISCSARRGIVATFVEPASIEEPALL